MGMKCSDPTCTHKAHKGRKKCFQCLVSKAKYMRYYRERRKAWLEVSRADYMASMATGQFDSTLKAIAREGSRLAKVCAKQVRQWDKERLAGEPNILDGIGTSIPVSAPPAGSESKLTIGIAE